MSPQELATALRTVMLTKDLSYKEVAALARRSVTSVQRARKGEKLSERTHACFCALVLSNG